MFVNFEHDRELFLVVFGAYSGISTFSLFPNMPFFIILILLPSKGLLSLNYVYCYFFLVFQYFLN